MIPVAQFHTLLNQHGIDFFTGVPDSLLKDFCAYLTDHSPANRNVIAANEGNALALACGYYMATSKIALVYMQNSGLGNIINPLTSLTDKLVYSIPALLLIGWRGEPGIKDEPQHTKQGIVTLEILETLGIRYGVLPQSLEDVEKHINEAVKYMLEYKEPYALVVSKNVFDSYISCSNYQATYELSREQAIKIVLDRISNEDIVVSTTGMASREVFEYRETSRDSHERDFLTVGSMGHASQIALGVALARKDKQIYCLDGDGAFIMHMGSLAIIGDQSPGNLKHIVLNNGAHDSVGGQPTVGFKLDIPMIARACGYKWIFQVKTGEDLITKIKEMVDIQGPALLEIRIRQGARRDLGRPTMTPIENKAAFMEFLSK